MRVVLSRATPSGTRKVLIFGEMCIHKNLASVATWRDDNVNVTRLSRTSVVETCVLKNLGESTLAV